MRKQLMKAMLLGMSVAVPATTAFADEPANKTGQVEQKATGEKLSYPAKRDEHELTEESLGEMLTNGGYNVEQKALKSKRPYFVVKEKRQDWNFSLDVQISPSRQFIWMTVPLYELPEDFSADEFRALLSNRDAVRAFYVLKGKRLYLYYVFDNYQVTPKRLRFHINELCDRINKSEKTWAFPKFRKVKSAVAAMK